VLNGRYVKTVTLDDGALTVVPAPRSLRPTRSHAAMETKIWATSQLEGGFRSQDLGFGLVSIRRTAPGVPEVKDLPAWIGFASNDGVSTSCPAMRADPTSPRATSPSAPPSSGEAAVIIGDRSSDVAEVYTARTVVCEESVKARVQLASEALSVPWIQLAPLSNGTVDIRAGLPACSSDLGLSVGGTWQARVITVLTSRTDDVAALSCVAATSITKSVALLPGTIDGTPPVLTAETTQVLHGPTGPQRVVSSAYHWPGR